MTTLIILISAKSWYAHFTHTSTCILFRKSTRFLGKFFLQIRFRTFLALLCAAQIKQHKTELANQNKTIVSPLPCILLGNLTFMIVKIIRILYRIMNSKSKKWSLYLLLPIVTCCRRASCGTFFLIILKWR